MSLQDELRAQKFAFAEHADGLAKIEGQDLSAITSDAGCNMLFVYLLNRWGSLFQAGALTKLGMHAEVHAQIVRAYLAAGCRPGEALACRHLSAHLPPGFVYQVELEGKLSPRTFLQRLLQELHEEMAPQAHAQLQATIAMLSGDESGRG